MRIRLTFGLFVFCLSSVLVAAPAWGQSARWFDRRAEQRENRQALVGQAQADKQVRVQQAQEAVGTLIEQVENNELVADFEDLAQLLAGLGRLDEGALGNLLDRLVALTPDQAPVEMSNENQTVWDEAVGSTREVVTARPLDLMRRAADAGEVSLAVELMWEVLWFDPDHPVIRKALGMRRISAKLQERVMLAFATPRDAVSEKAIDYDRFDPNRNWYTRFAAERLQDGLVWDTGLGWVNPKHKKRYARGGVYDLQRRGWFTLDEANAFHAQVGKQWEIRTEHLLIRGTAELSILADAATQLEAFYREIFGMYARFFAGNDRLDVLRLALGLVESKPLEVWILKDKKQYMQVSNAPGWSAGVFKPSTGVCYFFGRVTDVMFHEFTHQILGVFARKNNAPSWLVEGIAVYTETATFSHGRVEIPGARPSEGLTLEDLLKLRSGKAWHRYHNRGDKSAYGDAGSLATFCMNAKGGVFRADFIDFVRDSYLGRTKNAALWDYLGQGEAAFAREYEMWRRR